VLESPVVDKLCASETTPCLLKTNGILEKGFLAVTRTLSRRLSSAFPFRLPLRSSHVPNRRLKLMAVDCTTMTSVRRTSYLYRHRNMHFLQHHRHVTRDLQGPLAFPLHPHQCRPTLPAQLYPETRIARNKLVHYKADRQLPGTGHRTKPAPATPIPSRLFASRPHLRPRRQQLLLMAADTKRNSHPMASQLCLRVLRYRVPPKLPRHDRVVKRLQSLLT
jgi:hypothetical protein